MKVVNILFLFLIIVSCQNNSTPTNTNTYLFSNDTISRLKLNFKLDKLNRKANKALNENTSFNEIKKSLDTIKKTNYANLYEVNSSLQDYLIEFKQQLDLPFQNKGVLSRINQIENYSNKLEYLITKEKVDTTLINTNVKKVLSSYNSLVIQLNEAVYDIPEQIKKQIKKKDSIIGEPLF